MKKIAFFIVAVCINFSFLYADEKEQEQEKASETQKEQIDADSDENINAIDTMKEVLAYGIESEILDVIKKTDKHDFEILHNDFIELFEQTKSPVVKENLVHLYQENEHNGLQNQSIAILTDYTEHQRMLVKAALAYIGNMPPADTAELSTLLQKIIKQENNDYIIEAINTLGNIGGTEDANFLIEYFETATTADERQELLIQQSIASALEKIHSENSWDFLFELASDENENAYVRASAASGLAQIGKPEAFDILAQFFEDAEPLLRAAAMKGIIGFNTAESKKLLLQGFKDPYDKVRLEALKTVQETKDPEAIPYVLYRAKKDPVPAVRYAAIETLAVLNVSEGNEWLSDTFCNEKKGATLRSRILKSVMKQNPSILSAKLDKVILPLVSDKKKKQIRYAFGKIIAKIETPDTASLCIAYLESDDVMTKTIGLGMYKTNRYPSAVSLIEKIAEDKKQGNLQRIAKRLLQ